MSGSQERLKGFVSENEERGHCPKTGGEWVIAASVTDPLNDVFAAKFLQIIGGVARAVLEWPLLAEQAYAGGDIGRGKSVGRGGQGDQRLDDVAHACLVEIDATDASFADLRSEWETLEHIVGDKALIDAAEGIGKSLEYGF